MPHPCSGLTSLSYSQSWAGEKRALSLIMLLKLFVPAEGGGGGGGGLKDAQKNEIKI